MITQKDYTREKILSMPGMKEQYHISYPSYTPAAQELELLKPLLSNVQTLIILGTWCSDSQLHVSCFYKIADELGIAENNISLICVDETKKAEQGLIDQLNIVSVPTFIFMKNGEEIGRITEAPDVSLESDMVQILKK